MKQSISISLDMPDHLARTLDNIQQKLNSITQATGAASQALSNVANHVAPFDTLANAIKHLNDKTIQNAAKTAIKKAKKITAAAATNAQSVSISLNTTAQELNAKSAAKLSSAQIALAAGSKKAAAGFVAKAAALKVASVAIKAASVAKAAFNAVMMMNPFIAVAAGAIAFGTAIAGVISWLTRSREATTEAGKSISDLAEYYGRSTEQIEADMERMGTTCLDVWEAQEQGIRALAEEIGVSTDEIRDRMEQMGITCIEVFTAQEESLQSLSDKWGICSDQIREEIAGLVEELGCHEAAMATWEAQQYEMLQGIAEEWNMCTSEILAQMQEQGISAEQWASQMGQAWDSFQADQRIIAVDWRPIIKATLFRAA